MFQLLRYYLDLIGQAYGSVETFFELLEKQRIALDVYAHSCMDRGSSMEGIFLVLIAKSAIGWGKRFKDEYRNLDVRIKYR
jgi:phage-related minor tail protein